MVDFITKGSSNSEIVAAIRRSVQMPGSKQLFGSLVPRSPDDTPSPKPDDTAASSKEARIAELEGRVASLEQSVIKLLGR